MLADGPQSAALAASREWGQRAREWDARQRRIAAELRRDGWWIAPSWPVLLPARLVEIRRANGKRALNRAICEIYVRNRHREIRRMVASWMGDPAFNSRGPIIRDALADHVMGRYRVSIPTLLPLTEGIAVEVLDRAALSPIPRSCIAPAPKPSVSTDCLPRDCWQRLTCSTTGPRSPLRIRIHAP